MNKKKEIGKGLKALLANIENKAGNTEERKELVEELSSSVAEIKTDQIETNPFQPRTEFDSEELLELARSLKVHGLIQPITVRSMGDGSFQLISGERRLRASKMAGLKSIPAYIRVANDQEMLEMALVENIQRSNLNAIEIAISYQRLMEECKLTQDQLSERVGKKRSTVSNYIRLLRLPPNIQSGIKEGKISMGHARAIAGVDDPVMQMSLYQKTISEGLSVRALESMAKAKIISPGKSSSQEITSHPEILKLSRKYSGLFGTKVEIKRNNKGKGQFVIKFNNDNELNKIAELLDEITD